MQQAQGYGVDFPAGSLRLPWVCQHEVPHAHLHGYSLFAFDGWIDLCFLWFWFEFWFWGLVLDGGKNPVFQEKINIPLIEGLREITVTVWNSNTITFDDFIGTGRFGIDLGFWLVWNFVRKKITTLKKCWCFWWCGFRIQLQKVLSQGYDDSSWPLQSKSGKYGFNSILSSINLEFWSSLHWNSQPLFLFCRFAGEVTVIMHFANAKVLFWLGLMPVKCLI